MNKFCSNCGNRIADNSVFCHNCGNRLNDNIENDQTGNKSISKEGNSALKTASLILGIISIVLAFLFNFLIIPLAITGLILGIIYSAKSKKFCAGIILNILGIIIPIVIIVLLAVAFENISSSINDMWDEAYDYYDDYQYEDNYYNDDVIQDDYYKQDSDVDSSYYSDNSTSEELQEDSHVEQDDNSYYFKEIKLNDLIDFINNKKDFILVVSQTGCGHCASYKPKIKNIANNYKFDIYYIEFDLLSYDEKSSFSSYIDITGTPTTVFMKSGVENKNIRIVGDKDMDELESILRTNGYIK